MVLCIGEILADVIGAEEDKTVFKIYAGGAPFNVAVNLKRAGGNCGFIGCVGKDVIGDYLKEFAAAVGFDCGGVQTDAERNTTMAFVSHVNGERDFSFFRRDTADSHIDISEIDFCAEELNIVHLGSLLLADSDGAALAERIAARTKAAGKTLSFDVNYRADIFRCPREARRVYAPFIGRADILKFSEDELFAFTGEEDFDKAAGKVARDGALLLVTLGSRGSYYSLGHMRGFVDTEKITPIDTTGAGDAFMAAVLKELDGAALADADEGFLRNALKKANLAGGIATQHRGAI